MNPVRWPHLFTTAVSCIVAAALGYAQTPAPTLGTPDEVRAFADSLDACKAGKLATAHPLMKTFVVEHVIGGEKDASCAYSQSMPGKMTMECGFSATGRKAMAADIRATASGGPMRGGTRQAQPEWAKECDVVMASGTRSPMVPAPRAR